MTHKYLLAVTLAFAAIAGLGHGPAMAQTAPAATAQSAAAMQPGQRMPLGAAVGERTIRQVMISQGGGGIEVIYDMPAGAPESKRVLRLENVNGMLEVIYDTAMPTTRPLASGGTPRLTTQGGGMYDVTYDR